MKVPEETVKKLINEYAREAGMRSLERFMKRICEKTAFKFLKQEISQQIVIGPERLKEFVGLPIFKNQKMYSDIPPAGIIIGLAYNSYGGSILFIETSKYNFSNYNQPK